MYNRTVVSVALLATIAIVVGCRATAPVVRPTPEIPATLAEILVFRGEVAVGVMGTKTNDVTISSVGGEALLSAWGKDTKGKAMAINPTWSTNQPEAISITPTVGPRVVIRRLGTVFHPTPELVVEQDGVKRTIGVWIFE